ncbi:hypothetical protein JCM33374_g4180 [Metschnikowia sp. JCM 33374]|nr:hypothetical protein JCM33374_g4180 [Metschnikowia sp. JCM 33374]
MRKSSFAESTKDASKHRGSSSEYRQNRTSTSLSKLNKDILNRRDVFGRNILHICVLSDDPASLRQVLRSGEIKNFLTATDYENGWNILHYIFYHKRLRCFNVLMAYLEYNQTTMSPILGDLLKKKDRSGVTPLSLLQNDVKDLFWIPQYINEKNRFHLVRRFLDPKKSPDSADISDDIPSNADADGNAEAQTATNMISNAQPHQTAQNATNISSLAHRKVDHDWWCDSRGGSDVYMFGSNANTNLGVGDSHDRTYPSRVGTLSKDDDMDPFAMSLRELLQKPRYRFVRMSKYHSVICTTDGNLYTCGIGSRGRLGHGNASNIDNFKKVKFPGKFSPVVDCAVSNNHTVVLNASGVVYAWGQNTLNQLGFTSSTPYNSFKTIADVYENAPVEVATGDLRKKTSAIKGIKVSKIHSVAYSSHSLYFWGLNIGQISLPQTGEPSDHRVNDKTYKGIIVSQPKEVQMRDEIKLVATCETCTCVVTNMNDMYLFYMGQRVKLPKIPSRVGSESHFDFFKPSKLTSAPSIKKVSMKSHSAVHILLESGDIMLFNVSSDDIKALRNIRYSFAWSGSEPSMRAVDMDNSYDGSLIVCTKNGSVLLRSNSEAATQRRASSSIGMGSFSFSTKKKFKKLEGVNRILRVACNDNFSSFSFVKDDIDSLPLKLQRNDFFKDMEYLSPFIEPDMYRKQDQLLDTDHDMNCYIADFLYPSAPKAIDSDEEKLLILNRLKAGFASFEEKEESLDSNDLLKKRMLEKYSNSKNKEPTTQTVFQKIEGLDLKSRFSLLKASVSADSPLLPVEWQRQKFADGKIEFSRFPKFHIGFHTEIFRKRSKLCQEIFFPKDEGEYFVHNQIEGAYNLETKTILFHSKVEPLAVLVFVYFVYTNTLIDFWQDYPKTDPNIDTIRRVKNDFISLMTLFKMDILYGKDEQYLEQLQDSATREAGDVTIGLSDGEKVYCPSSVISRSAFFETILSGRWDTGNTEDVLQDEDVDMKYVGLEEISLLHMRVILKHLQGCHDLYVFDEAHSVVAESQDSDDFVNFLLEMIEIADELLLVQLKHLCELAIKEFITTDNVLILLGHADWSGAKKLFMSCCWYIYNNLELVLFDQNLRDLNDEVLKMIEIQMQLLDKCKHPNFVVGKHGQINWKVSRQNSGDTTKNLVESFVTNLSGYNEVFMSDAKGFCKFEPLIDVKTDSLGDERRKSNGRKMSRKGSGDVLAEIQKLAISASVGRNNQPWKSGRRGSDSTRRESDCAIDDDDEFEVVTNKKRKPKPRLAGDRQPETGSTDSLAQGDNEVNVGLAPSMGALKEEQSSTRKESGSSRKPVNTPALGESLNLEKKQTKIKFAPSMKLSQKERRKMRSENENVISRDENVNKTQDGFRNPWNITRPEVEAKKTGGKGASKLNELPVLGQKEAPAPKLSAIILEEATRLAEEKEPVVTRTLQEIQQEQEFAKWWEEECKRVQQLEVASMEPMREGRAPQGSRTDSRRGGRSKRGRGKRGGQW